MKKTATPLKAFLIFGFFTFYFYLLLYTLLPFIKNNYSLNPALYWFITGYFLFIPIFTYAVMMVRKEGNKTVKEITSALNIKSFSKKDWQYSITGLIILFLSSGLIMGIAAYLHKNFGIDELTTSPWFIHVEPFEGTDKLLLLVWLPMFFFNIIGEEILWRGYIQNRMPGKYAWIICAVFWFMFHLPFGFDLLIILFPIIIIIPYIYYKTGNTLTGVFIHGLFNGPAFIMISLGIIPS